MTARSMPNSSYLVLLALAAGRTHGYAMMSFAEEVSGGHEQLPAGTLYRTLARLEAAGLIAESIHREPSAPQDAQRRYYRLTSEGHEALAEGGRHLERLVAVGRAGADSSRQVQESPR
jgi:DNA-binding PadR family transcriptional regulator